jgi:hypothetical protein
MWLWLWFESLPCGGGVEYLHRDPASPRRRRKGSLKFETIKCGRRAPRDLDSRKNALVKASSMYKRLTRPLVREGAPQKQDHNCQRVINNSNKYLVMSHGWGLTPRLTDWPSVAMWLLLWLPLMEVASNISTVALRVVGSDENGTQCLEV